MALQIGLTGDVMLGRLVNERQQGRPPAAVWGTLLDRLRSCDGLFINLECCLSRRGNPWQRTYRPFHFRADPDWAILALERAGVDGCALANNHVLDFEVEALLDTLDELDAADIAHAGCGRTLDEALDPAVVTIGDLTIAFVSFTDNVIEYAADETSPGTAYIEMDATNDTTRNTVQEVLELTRAESPDLVITSLHWGPNMAESPPDSFEQFGRWLLDEGVDVIHGHSAHVFHGIEVHDGKPILYDTGDFVDDYAIDNHLRNDRSFLFELSVTGDGRVSEIRLQPTEICDDAVHEASPDAAAWSRDRMRSLSDAFGTTFERDGEGLVLSLGS
ncbi:poly-gamma-glutamate synthesis protein (capsule biosynthesis protein) [Natronorubrum sediminis]|uniref:Poly-gamma-glutamate synthesis protein (Capsule biosynthesis protein) n=1 Tax=Natronorubrum sediminis TaxID=640943 RepID=A0A1H6G683_9EURY|nr:CapA family protein [Natronorubrum sediminis]SEH18130.1 poly-gamma-glutamate synthesis protein (capsule biosynthesis protein) [Natronorubrum sediminis]